MLMRKDRTLSAGPGQKKEHAGPDFSADDVAGTAVGSLSGLKPGPT